METLRYDIYLPDMTVTVKSIHASDFCFALVSVNIFVMHSGRETGTKVQYILNNEYEEVILPLLMPVLNNLLA